MKPHSELPAPATNGRHAAETAVPARYTWAQVYSTVTAARANSASLRLIARLFNVRAGAGQVVITHRTVQLILAGKEPKSASIRATLGLPVLLPAPVCPVHGVVHARACRVVPAWVTTATDWLTGRQAVTR